MPYLYICPNCGKPLPPPARDDDTLYCYGCDTVVDLRAPSEADREALAAVAELLLGLAARRKARMAEAEAEAAR